MLVEMKVNDFVEELSSSSPAPGGGTVSALTGAFAAGLGNMVCGLTIGNKKYPESQPYLPQVQMKLEKLENEFLSLADLDAEAFHKVMAAIRLNKETDADKEKRKKAMLLANTEAAEVPLRSAQAAIEVLELLPEVISYGNPNALSDCGVAMECARTACLGALMNVAINIPSIKDEALQKEFLEKKKRSRERLDVAYHNVAGVLALKFEY